MVQETPAVVEIQQVGEHTMLKNLQDPGSELKQVARALLTPEIMEDTKLLYEMLQYHVTD